MKRFCTFFFMNLIVILIGLTRWLNIASAQVRIPEPVLPPPAIREAFDLDPFYQQWIDVEGFPVIASAKVNPYAVKEAVWIIRQMIGHRPDILKVQADHQERLSVLAIDESMSNLPEYERVPETARIWIAYTRDIVCGTCQATLAAEENLLFPYSSYPHFLIHEFAHTIHHGLKRLGPEFDDRLKAAYTAAMEKGLWRGYYAASNRDEYWAEGTNSWFHSTQTNAVNTRTALKKYDPDLARLLTEIFGDGDWRYTPPATRTHLPHLQGFDPEDSPRHDGPLPWEIDARKLDEQLEDPNSDGDGKWVNLKLYPPSQLPSLLKSTTRGKGTIIFYVNPTGQEISFYTVDADGTENLRYHATRNIFDFGTYAGAIWLIKDHTGEDLAVFRAEEKTGRIIIGTGPSTNGTVLETGRIIIGAGPPTTGTELAIGKPSELTRDNFTIKPGEFAILVHRGEPAITGGTDFNNYFRIGKTDPQNAQAPDIPNLAHFFQNGGRIELISHITANPLPRHSSEAQFGDIVISEIMWGLDGTSPTRQYIELYNPSAHAYSFADADVSLRFSTVSEEPLPDRAFPPPHNSDVRVKVIDRVSNKGWKVPGRSGNTSENKPFISMYRTIDYTTGDVPDGTLVTSWKASTGRVNLRGLSYGTPGAKHLPPTPVVLIEASQRLPMYWIDADAGTLHRLIGDTVENLVPNVRNATDLAADMTGGKLYWTEKTGERTGRIRRATLDGTNVQLVKNLASVPHSIALDTTNGKIYLTNAYGKIQRMNLDGSNFQPNLITGLESPRHLVLEVTGGKVYWTETPVASGRIRRANLDGSNVQRVKDLTSSPRGIALDAANRKLYLTNAYGKVQRLNLDGSNFQPNLITGLDGPKGVSVDVAGRKLYWTEQGSIRRADLNGENIEDVVTGLVSPSNIVHGIGAMPPATTSTPEPPTTPVVDAAADVNADKKVNKTDLLLVVTALGESPPANPNFDVNDDGTVNIADLLLVIEALDDPVAAAAPSFGETVTALDPAFLRTQIDILRAESDGSLKYEHALAFFQALLSSLRPTETRLLANYPNPFNPETWIPYQLAVPADVSISIYAADGQLVQTLTLGHQSAGIYESRPHAAHWEGRNAVGERVASGVYFYTLSAGDFTATRKMLITK